LQPACRIAPRQSRRALRVLLSYNPSDADRGAQVALNFRISCEPPLPCRRSCCTPSRPLGFPFSPPVSLWSRHYARLLRGDVFGFYLLDSDFRGFASEKDVPVHPY